MFRLVHFIYFISGGVLFYIIGTTVGAGAHRLWSHRSYRASTVLKVYLMLGHTLAGHVSALFSGQIYILHSLSRSNSSVTRNLLFFPLFFLRTRPSSGLATIEFTTNFQTPTAIHTTLGEAFSLPTVAGYYVKSILNCV